MYWKIVQNGISFDCSGNCNVSVVQTVKTLTHDKGEYYMEYIKRVSRDSIAKEIKLADLRHNSDITRMKGLGQKDFDRLQKYFTAYAYLNG